MSKSEVDESPDKGTERAEDRVNQKHQKALGRFGKYSAPALLAGIREIGKRLRLIIASGGPRVLFPT